MEIVRSCLALALAIIIAAIPSLARAADPWDSEPVTVIAHLDIIPNFLDQELSVVQQFVKDSANDPGVQSFVLATWTPAPNHFQIIEIYRSLGDFNNHVVSAHTIAFRKAIQPYIGAPWDERRYRSSDHDDR